MWFNKTDSNASDTHNLYSDIEDKESIRDSGQYSAIDVNASQPKNARFSYINNENASSGFVSSHSSKDETVCVVDTVTDNGTSATQMYAVPMKSRKLPLLPPAASDEQLYAQPDKTKRVKLTSQSSAYSETQMLENDLYNI